MRYIKISIHCLVNNPNGTKDFQQVKSFTPLLIVIILSGVVGWTVRNISVIESCLGSISTDPTKKTMHNFANPESIVNKLILVSRAIRWLELKNNHTPAHLLVDWLVCFICYRYTAPSPIQHQHFDLLGMYLRGCLMIQVSLGLLSHSCCCCTTINFPESKTWFVLLLRLFTRYTRYGIGFDWFVGNIWSTIDELRLLCPGYSWSVNLFVIMLFSFTLEKL